MIYLTAEQVLFIHKRLIDETEGGLSVIEYLADWLRKYSVPLSDSAP